MSTVTRRARSGDSYGLAPRPPAKPDRDSGRARSLAVLAVLAGVLWVILLFGVFLPLAIAWGRP